MIIKPAHSIETPSLGTRTLKEVPFTLSRLISHVAKLNPDGVGNWFKLHLPMEVAGRRENLEFTMTASKSHARTTYY